MPITGDLIKKEDCKAAEARFLKKAADLLEQGEYDKIRNLIENFPEDYRHNRILLQFYYYISTHISDPYGARKKLFELIPKLKAQADFDRVAKIYITLLINYIYYDEDSDDLTRLSDEAMAFVAKTPSRLSVPKKKQVKLWCEIAGWWLHSADSNALDISIRLESRALELKDSEALIVIRVLLTDFYYLRGQFQQALSEYEKAERLLNKRKADAVYAPFVYYWRCETYLLMRLFEKAKQEAEKGLALIAEGCMFRDYFRAYQFLYHVFMQNYEACEAIRESVLYGQLKHDAYFRIHFMYSGEMILSYFAQKKEKAAYYCTKIMNEKGKKFFLYVWPHNIINFAEVNLYIEDYDTVTKSIENVLVMKPEDEFPFYASAAHAIMGVMYARKREREKAARHFEMMENAFLKNELEEIAILSNILLSEIADISGSIYIQQLLRRREINETIGVPADTEKIGRDNAADHHNIEVSAFGNLKIIVDGNEFPPALLSRQKRIFNIIKLLLVYHDMGVPRDFLYNMFWNGFTEQVARHNLNAGLYRIRKIFGKDFISVDGEIIRLSEGNFWFDVEAFENNISLGNKALQKGLDRQAIKYFQDAEDLYKNDFIENDLYTEFVTSKRASLKHKYLLMLFTSTKLYLNDNKFDNAFKKGQKLIRKSPCCEPAYRLLMMACALSGDLGSLSALYNKLKQMLTRELQAEPDRKTNELMKMLMNHKSPTQAMWDQEQCFD